MYFIPWLIPWMPCYVRLEARFKVLINSTTPCLVKLAEACSATKTSFLSPMFSRWPIALPPSVSAQVFLWPCSERSENWSQWKLTWFKKRNAWFSDSLFPWLGSLSICEGERWWNGQLGLGKEGWGSSSVSFSGCTGKCSVDVFEQYPGTGIQLGYRSLHRPA